MPTDPITTSPAPASFSPNRNKPLAPQRLRQLAKKGRAKKKKRCRARWPHTCCRSSTSKLLPLHKANSEPNGLQGFSTLPTAQPSTALSSHPPSSLVFKSQHLPAQKAASRRPHCPTHLAIPAVYSIPASQQRLGYKLAHSSANRSV